MIHSLNICNQRHIEGRVVYIAFRSKSPDLISFDNFLSFDECYKLIELYKPNTSYKNSDNKLIVDIQNRISAFLELKPNQINDVFIYKNKPSLQSTSFSQKMILHLSDSVEGGAFEFPDSGLNIVPRRGAGFVFSQKNYYNNQSSVSINQPMVKGNAWHMEVLIK